MNIYKMTYVVGEGETKQAYITERTEAAARKTLKRIIEDREIVDVELYETDAQATKEQERETLEKIKAMVAELGPHSYLATAFEGVFEDAYQNIENDFAVSMKGRVELAEGRANNLEHQVAESKQRIAQLEEALKGAESKAQAAEVGVEELIQKDDERKDAIMKMSALLSELAPQQETPSAGRRRPEAQVVQLKAKLYDFMTAQQ